MMRHRPLHSLAATFATVAGSCLLTLTSQAAPLNISNSPLFLTEQVAPLNLLVLSRDHRLYYEAYNDASDLDGDGAIDYGYKPAVINYLGYFDSFLCYQYSSNRWNPVRRVDDEATKTCTANDGDWSGDYLNYLTTARIDALRRVLYGGKRSTDVDGETVLERSFIPQDGHSWGKEYESIAVNGFDIRQYTSLDMPSAGRRHLLANNTLFAAANPTLRILTNRTERIWGWVSKEAPVGGSTVCPDSNPACGTTATPTAYNVRVLVCDDDDPDLLDSVCRRYPNGNWKPGGLLHDFAESSRMKFGLLSGSYEKPRSGGVLRRAVGNLVDTTTPANGEIDPTSGRFNTAVVGVIGTIDRLRISSTASTTANTNYDFNGPGASNGYQPTCDRAVIIGTPTGAAANQLCRMWGNPVAEMLYEAVRYFAGATTPTANFTYTTDNAKADGLLGLPNVTSWTNPYASNPVCAKPFATVISDTNISYDTDELPGTAFGSGITSTLSGLNVATRADALWASEFGTGATKSLLIGQSTATNYDGAPTAKTATGFSGLRGLAPEEPTKQGGYYAAAVANYAFKTDLQTARAGDQKMTTFAVALASPLPRIVIPMAGGRNITLVPFAKSVRNGPVRNSTNANPPAGSNLTSGGSSFQPTNQIIDFYVENLAADGTSGSFRINYEDVEQGSDHDMDAIARYSYTKTSDTTVQVDVQLVYSAGGIDHHIGYVASGTDHDGVYLEIRDDTSGGTGNYVDYFLDTPPGQNPGGSWDDNVPLPTTTTRTLTLGDTPSAEFLRDPLWYAAKWGGYDDLDSNGTISGTNEWDVDGPTGNPDGNPDNYFLVTNALTLKAQLEKTFNKIIEKVTSASSASINTGSISTETRLYQAKFNSGNWTGQLLSYELDQATGALLSAPEWDAASRMPASNSRRIITRNSDGTPARFRWDGSNGLDATRQAQLQPLSDGRGEDRLNYLRGSASDEVRNGGLFRNRPTTVLGDIVASSPLFVGRPNFRHRDDLESEPYSQFRADNVDRRPMVYVGGNDGMLHAFDARDAIDGGGVEALGYIPGEVFPELHRLADPRYGGPGQPHRFFVEGTPNSGDVFFDNDWHTVLVSGLNKGGQGIFALDITDPTAFSEANAGDIALWEFTDSDDADLGYSFSQPAIVRLANGSWSAVFGNGYNSTEADGAVGSGNAVLFIVDIEDGSVIRKIDTGVGPADDPTGLGRPNGLATPAVVDINGDSIADFVYAGDLYGNLWKFKLSGADESDWDVAYEVSGDKVPLFQAISADGDAQPITSRPEVGRGPAGIGVVVLFGTGKFLEPTDRDLGSAVGQSFYGILDRNTGANSDRVTDRGDLLEQTIIDEGEKEFSRTLPDGTTQTITRNVRVTSNNALTSGLRGWFIDLESPSGFEGEMVVADSVLRGGRVIFTTIIPDPDPCAFGGRSWLMEIDSITGSRLGLSPFDLNNDRQFSDPDNAQVDTDGDGVPDTAFPISGLASSVGLIPRPGVLAAGPVEYKYTPGTSGEVEVTVENPGPSGAGRQSWRQIR